MEASSLAKVGKDRAVVTSTESDSSNPSSAVYRQCGFQTHHFSACHFPHL